MNQNIKFFFFLKILFSLFCFVFVFNVFNYKSDEVGNHYIAKESQVGKITFFKPLINNMKLSLTTNE